MLWLDPDTNSQGYLIDSVAPDATDLTSRSVAAQGADIGADPYTPEGSGIAPTGAWLTQNQYIKWDEGGTYDERYWLGFDTGMNPADFASYAMTGEVAVPENQLALALSEKWGDVGASSLGDQLAAGTDQNVNAWMPPANELAMLALIPGFGVS